MQNLLTKRLVIAWIAMLSVLFGVLAPPMTQAMASASASASGNEEVQICTAEGMKTIVIVQEGSGKRKAPSSECMSKHCAYCVLHANIPLLPRVAFILPLQPQAGMLPPLFYQSTTPLFAWTVHVPRGPPFSI
ncbi:DUF2946 domain-containing protein [Massilia phyllosphaerae]|uniref:DUF2946 domain-containing protein n=1 Tax=Massilia phyllosphaerae TaxID=3106034 RepID=UPI002B1CDB8E|nr:DUF2946 domain-containing protein [Massilia sp. SGZ-792]